MKNQTRKCVNYWQKSVVFLATVVNLPSWWGQNEWLHDGWCPILAATLHWLLLTMWHANHLINSPVLGQMGELDITKKHDPGWDMFFMNEMEHFGPMDRLELWVSDIQDGIHARLALHHLSPFGKNHHRPFTISFHESPLFQFLAEALKNVLSRRFNTFWERVSWVTGTKQLFWYYLTLCRVNDMANKI